MKILVTGCAGFIGSNLVDFLLQKNYQVVGIDNFNDFYSPKIKHQNLIEANQNPNFKLHEFDLLDFEKLEKVISEERPDAIVHLAAYAGVTYSFEKPLVYVRNNLEVTTELLNLSKKYEINNFIFASTSSIYGENPTPFVESMPTDLPLAPYPATKKACEVMIATFVKNTNINATILRFFNPLDIRVRTDLALYKLIKSAEFGDEFPQYQDLNSTGRDYCYLQNMLDAIEFILQNPFKYEIFNLGNSSPVTLGKLVEAVEKVTEKKVNLVKMSKRAGEMTLTYADVSKAKRMLGYKAETPIEFIVEKYYKWFLSQPEWYKKGEF
jgi:UDP-glucuronate 4-epimerase